MLAVRQALVKVEAVTRERDFRQAVCVIRLTNGTILKSHNSTLHLVVGLGRMQRRKEEANYILSAGEASVNCPVVTVTLLSVHVLLVLTKYVPKVHKNE